MVDDRRSHALDITDGTTGQGSISLQAPFTTRGLYILNPTPYWIFVRLGAMDESSQVSADILIPEFTYQSISIPATVYFGFTWFNYSAPINSLGRFGKARAFLYDYAVENNVVKFDMFRDLRMSPAQIKNVNIGAGASQNLFDYSAQPKTRAAIKTITVNQDGVVPFSINILPLVGTSFIHRCYPSVVGFPYEFNFGNDYLPTGTGPRMFITNHGGAAQFFSATVLYGAYNDA